MDVRYEDISEDIPAARRPWLDRFDRVDPGQLDAHALEWWRDGVVHLPGFLPANLIDAYVHLRSQLPLLGGWRCPVPYLYYRELRDICLYQPMMAIMRKLIGFEMGLHLNLTGWTSTERALHADDYLNPIFVNSHYCAAWIALDDIPPGCGPFQYVPGSHRWPTIRQQKIFQYLKPEQRGHSWPSDTQDWVERACLREIERRGAQFETYLPKRGDVLLWHGCLLHRGSVPTEPGALRKALIAHYSSIQHRSDMPFKRKWKGQWMFILHAMPLDPGSPRPTVSLADQATTKLANTAYQLTNSLRRRIGAR